ncbi:MAG: Mov34/MPN/PAD-1 family protein [Candidatus Omnitrophica bacterium]|nr:Mov34/MPN/PAD-1 family protein [Candidatus Omnitrophota bacterium]MCM8802618.1 Mov34/MPN/PAD-1 family protein [Candidatus Omnitrophota bacterium]
MIYLTKEQYVSIVNHTKKEYPKEACGILAGINGRVIKVYKMANISDNPESCYFMKPEEQIKVFKEMRQLGIEMLGIYHSHSNTSAYPSQRDCELAFYSEVDYLIISLKNFNNPEIRAFKIVKGKIYEEKIIIRKNILFVCIENSCRSQIAEGIVNNLYWQKFVAYSAGSKPSGIVNPKAIEVMKEIGIDISNQKSKGFQEIKDIEFDYVITMGCGDVCPVYSAKHKFEWKIEDPKDKPIEFFREIRDEIHEKIKEMVLYDSFSEKF